jgi:hypothetical protein
MAQHSQWLTLHLPGSLVVQVSVYLPEWLPASSIYQPDAPKPEDVAVLIEGDEEVDVETLRQKGVCVLLCAAGLSCNTYCLTPSTQEMPDVLMKSVGRCVCRLVRCV